MCPLTEKSKSILKNHEEIPHQKECDVIFMLLVLRLKSPWFADCIARGLDYHMC